MNSDSKIERIVHTHACMLVRLAASRLGSASEAEDVVQDVFLKVVEGNIRFADEDHERAWLVRATINRAMDVRKQAARKHVPLDESSLNIEEDLQAAWKQDGLGLALLECMRDLPEKYAIPLHLHYYEGYSQKEVASILKLPSATIRTRLARGRKKLESMLEERRS